MGVGIRCPNPSCTGEVQVAETEIGRESKCPDCGLVFVVSGSTASLPTAGTVGASESASLATTAMRLEKPTDGPAVTRALSSADSLPQIGRFEPRARLGSGAFGTVYRAYDPHLDREVAVKVPQAGTLTGPKRVERFLREARAAAQLRHPHIVPIFDAGKDGDNYYIASAFIRGQTLEQAIEEEKPDYRRAAQIVRDLAEALAYAHSLGIVHRDVKPANVMLDEKGQPHLMDFGLAHRHDSAEKLTHEGAILGTPTYMAPEQAKGQSGDPLPASDQYSLGVMLYELLTGSPPFRGPAQVVIFNQIETEPPPPRSIRRDVPPELEAICLKALAKRPEERYASCQELADDLRRWLHGEPTRASPPGLAILLMGWLRKNVGATVRILLVGLVCGGVASLMVSMSALAWVFKRMEETYELFPSLDPPVLTGFRWAWQIEWLLVVPLGWASLLGMGLFAVLLTRPKDRWSDAGTGLATGLWAGLVTYALGIGPASVLFLTLNNSVRDLELVSDATSLNDPPSSHLHGPVPPRKHPTDRLVKEYPDLESAPPDERGGLFLRKILMDMAAGSFLAVWYGLALSFGICSSIGVIQAMTAGHLLRQRQRVLPILVPYVEITVFAFGMTWFV